MQRISIKNSIENDANVVMKWGKSRGKTGFKEGRREENEGLSGES